MTDTAGQVSDETLAELRHAALCAIAGPWKCERVGSNFLDRWYITGPDWPNGKTCHITQVAGTAMGDTAEFIAAADPPTVLALLDTVDALRAERDAACERLARVEALHVPYAPRPYGTAPLLKYTCRHDRMPWPCRTIAALADTAKEATT